MRKARAKRQDPPLFAGLPDVLARMRLQNGELGDELGLELAERATRQVGTPDGPKLAWTWDPMQRGQGPVEVDRDHLFAFMRGITAPVLYLHGDRGYRWPDQAERLGQVADVRALELPGVGHMLHWFAPDAVADALNEFLGPA